MVFQQLAVGDSFRFAVTVRSKGRMEKNSSTTYVDPEGRQWKCGHLALVEKLPETPNAQEG